MQVCLSLPQAKRFTDTPQPSATPGPTIAPSAAPTPAPTSAENNDDSENNPQAGTTASRTTDATDAPRTTKAVSIPSNAFPGGVNIISPNTRFGISQYYAIKPSVSSTVTWVWNYTSLYKTPAHIDVVATMASTAGGLNPSPFTLSSNMSFAKTQTFEWDTGEYAKTSGMPTGVYTLQIYDADLPGGPTAVPQGGRLAPFNGWQFGVYTPAAYYVVEPAMQCVTCNAAGGSMERLAWGTLFGTVALTVGTMAWFTGAVGVW